MNHDSAGLCIMTSTSCGPILKKGWVYGQEFSQGVKHHQENILLFYVGSDKFQKWAPQRKLKTEVQLLL